MVMGERETRQTLQDGRTGELGGRHGCTAALTVEPKEMDGMMEEGWQTRPSG